MIIFDLWGENWSLLVKTCPFWSFQPLNRKMPKIAGFWHKTPFYDPKIKNSHKTTCLQA